MSGGAPKRNAVALALMTAAAAGCRVHALQPVRSQENSCPPEMAWFAKSGFCIPRWEASLVTSTAEGDRPFSPYETPQGRPVRAVSRAGVVPQGYISRDDAEQACRLAGKRLCLESEWVAACRGAPPRAFPYGDVREKGACNEGAASPLHIFYPEAPETYRAGPMNDPRLNQQPRTVARTGEYTRCKNDLGVFDLVGNLHEWVMSPKPTFRGGYYQDTHMNGDGCAYQTTAHAAAYHDYSTGFRCCSSPGSPSLPALKPKGG